MSMLDGTNARDSLSEWIESNGSFVKAWISELITYIHNHTRFGTRLTLQLLKKIQNPKFLLYFKITQVYRSCFGEIQRDKLLIQVVHSFKYYQH